MTSTSDALTRITAILAEGRIVEARREARLILAYALGCDAAGLFSREAVPMDASLAMATRRAAGEPLAYITGHREFWSLDLLVSPATLIPRPDTETLIEVALASIADRNRIRTIVDLGTGTGALLLAALTEFPEAFGVGTDLVPEATRLAQKNAERTGLAHRSAFVVTDWAEGLAGRFDLILANPPYIRSPDITSLMHDVAAFEPRSALDGGPEGFDAYHAIIAALPRLLAPHGVAIVEAGVDQAEAIIGIADRAGLTASAHPDLAGILRAICITAVGEINVGDI